VLLGRREEKEELSFYDLKVEFKGVEERLMIKCNLITDLKPFEFRANSLSLCPQDVLARVLAGDETLFSRRLDYILSLDAPRHL